MLRIETVKELRKRLSVERLAGISIGFVPTMGFFHDGHLALMMEAKKSCQVVVVSIFVNPTQFGPNEDFRNYPRDLERDLKLAEKAGVDYIFTPSVDEVYPEGCSTVVEVEGALVERLCGRYRPGHFKGVATVVAKLFNMVRPDVAFFGRKDYQQLKVVERMARDLNFDVEIRGIETAREEDGLAMSSRNAYLSLDERAAALSLNRALKAVDELVAGGERRVQNLIEAARAVMEKEPLVGVEYLEICDPETLAPLDEVVDEALVAVSARVGKARLIDNALVSAERMG